MNNRKGIIMLMFDLPVSDKKQRRNYHRFRKTILCSGYIQLQESLYIKLLQYSSEAKNEAEKIRRISPEEGNIKILPLSLNKFKQMITISGEEFDVDFFADDIVCI